MSIHHSGRLAFFLAVALVFPHLAAASAIPALVANLKPGHWAEVPDSKMTQVFYQGPLAKQIHGHAGPASTVLAWGGGALDTKRDRLIIWGGGHTDYAGNEVYAFDLRKLKWERLSNPSSIAGYDGKSGEYPDGTPASTHTYDAMTYLPDPYDGLFISMLPGTYKAGYGSLVSWFFDFKTNKWKKLGRAIAGSIGNSMTVYDPVSGHVWEQGGIFSGQTFILEYDPERNTWSKRNNGSDSLPYYVQTAVIDPVEHLFVAVGGGLGLLFHGQSRIALDVWNLNAVGNAKTPVRSGPLDVENSSSPGFVWYPPGKVFVGWPNGGASVYSLDPKTWKWEMHPAAADNRVVPPHTFASGGTFGRFQYVPSMGVFVLENGPAQNVYLYKPDFGTGSAAMARNCTLPSVKDSGTMKLGLGIPVKIGISASNNPTSYYAGGLPPGLTFDAKSGIISGAPNVPGKFDITVGAYSRCGTGKPETISAIVEARTPFRLASNGRRYPSLQKAVEAAFAGDRIEVDPGTYANYIVYAQIRKPLTIEGKGGMASFVSTIPIPNRKGIIISDVPNGMALKIDHLDISGAFIGSGDGANAAAIRLETGNLVVENSYIHDNQNGILSGDDKTSMAKISNSVIAHNGLGREGFTHGVYFSHGAEVEIDHSTFMNDTYGHHIKSRAAKTVVSNSLIDDGTVQNGASYDIDTPNGGAVTIHCNSIVKNSNAGNYPMVTTGEEGGLYAANSLAVTDNLFTSNAAGKPIVGVRNSIPGMTAAVTGNIFVRIPHDTAGSGSFSSSDNTDSRSNASPPRTCGRIGANLELAGKPR